MSAQHGLSPSRITQVSVVGALILLHGLLLAWFSGHLLLPAQLMVVLGLMLLVVLLAMRHVHRLAEVYVAQSGFIVEVRYGWLRKMVDEQARAAGLACAPRCIVYEDEAINAFVAGGSPARARLFLSSACLRRLGRKRLAVIIAHEISHIRNGDMVALTTMQAMFALAAWPFWLIWLLVRYLAPVYNDGALRLALRATYWLSFLLTPTAGLASLLILRRWEYQADHAASVRIGKKGFVETMRCLNHVQSPAGEPRIGASCLFASVMAVLRSHPPLERRIKAIQGS